MKMTARSNPQNKMAYSILSRKKVVFFSEFITEKLWVALYSGLYSMYRAVMVVIDTFVCLYDVAEISNCVL
jgi:hypothetical protein